MRAKALAGGPHVGLHAAKARELVGVVTPYETGEHGANEPNRWSAGKDDREWRGLRPELVAEVSFDHVSGRRIRHGARLLRFRDDKPPQTAGSTSSTVAEKRGLAPFFLRRNRTHTRDEDAPRMEHLHS